MQEIHWFCSHCHAWSGETEAEESGKRGGLGMGKNKRLTIRQERMGGREKSVNAEGLRGQGLRRREEAWRTWFFCGTCINRIM